MKEKYFTPEPEDICIGYECEAHFVTVGGMAIVDLSEGGSSKVIQEPHIKQYQKVKCGVNAWTSTSHDIMLQLLENGQLRVPYLTPEQVEADGWEPISMKNIELENRYPFQKGNYFLVLDLRHDVPMIDIILRDVSLALGKFDNPERFRIWMRCKDINTFRKICKLALT